MKKISRTKRAVRAVHDLVLPLEIREARTRVRRRLRQAALELEILAILEDELLERFRLLCSRPTIRRDV